MREERTMSFPFHYLLFVDFLLVVSDFIGIAPLIVEGAIVLPRLLRLSKIMAGGLGIIITSGTLALSGVTLKLN